MTHGSLFSGIGGFDLAAEWMGWDNAFHCEWNPFGQKILKHYWPHAISYNDITKTDFSIHRGAIDVLTGGFPCQPYSTAGKRKGKEDERHLWPEMLRAIREIQPSYVVGENVRGLVNWNRGLVFDEVQADLETSGYQVTPFLLPACGINAPHRRERIWFVAYSDSFRRIRSLVKDEKFTNSRRKYAQCDIVYGFDNGIITNSNSIGLQGRENVQAGKNAAIGNCWSMFPTQSAVCDGDDGLSVKLDGITFSDWRYESVKGGGNAIVPQIAHQIFKTIDAYEHQY